MIPTPTTPPHELTLDEAMSSMLGVMFNVTAMMVLGYTLEGKGLSDSAQKGLSLYIVFGALPALFFSSLSAENFVEAEASVLAAVVLGKLAMVALSYLMAWCAHRLARLLAPAPDRPDRMHPDDSRHRSAQQFKTPAPGGLEFRAGTFALLTTNGDEIGLGVPAVTALFPEKLPLLFVLAGIQKMLFLPIALVLLGVGEAKREAAKSGAAAQSAFAIFVTVLKHKASDPLVLSIFGGLLYNIVGPALEPPCDEDAASFACALWQSTGYAPGLLGGARVPSLVQSLCAVLGQGFTPTIFLLSGAASVGTWGRLADAGALPLPLVLVLLESLEPSMTFHGPCTNLP